MFRKILDFVARYSTTIIIGLLAFWILKPALAETKTILLIIVFEMLALILSGLASYVLFTLSSYRYLAEGDDQKMNSVERHAVLEFKSRVFLGVHFLTGLCVIGFYIAQIG